MARIIYSGLVSEIGGSVGGLTFQPSAVGNSIRTKPRPLKNASLSQMRARSSMSLVQNAWYAMSTADRADWQTFIAYSNPATKHNASVLLTGYQLFLKINVFRLIAGLALVLTPDELVFNPTFVPANTTLDIYPALTVFIDCEDLNTDYWYNLYLSSPRPSGSSFKKEGCKIVPVTPGAGKTFDIESNYLSVFGHLPPAGTIVNYIIRIFGLNTPQFSIKNSGSLIVQDSTPPPKLDLEFDDIAEADTRVGDRTNVADWNTFFNLPVNGTEFTSVSEVGDTISLVNPGHITMTNGGSYYENLFSGYDHLLSVSDLSGIVTGFGEGVFYNCVHNKSAIFYAPVISSEGWIFGCDTPIDLAVLSFPNLIEADDYMFAEIGYGGFTAICTFDFSSLVKCNAFTFWLSYILENVNFPSLVEILVNCFGNCMNLVDPLFPKLEKVHDFAFLNCFKISEFDFLAVDHLGDTVGDDSVFSGIAGKIIHLSCKPALLTCNAGNPDGDIQYLDANNTLTIN